MTTIISAPNYLAEKMIVDLATRATRRFLVGNNQEFVFAENNSVSLPPIDRVGLYIHIPFCRNMCPYCPYNRVQYDKNLVGPYTRALLSEIEQYYSALGRVEIPSIYIGGGTPTNLVDELGIILKSIEEKFTVTGDICMETSPSDLNSEVVRKLKDFGVDLISIGVQSFSDKFLKSLGRDYNSTDVKSVVNLVLASSFRSVNIDLMFALPGQDIEDVVDDLRETIKIKANQVTTYPLFTFPYSSVGRHLKMKNVRMPNIFKRRKMYRKIHDFFAENGYQRVSVWGFRKGNAPRYSSVTRDNYIGIGAGACSKLSGGFYLNTFSVEDYIHATLDGRLPIALTMDLGSSLGNYYWLYWRFYDTYIDKQELYGVFGRKDPKLQMIFRVARLLGLCRESEHEIELTERGSFYIHLIQNYFVLNYIDKVWSVAMKEPWPKRIKI